MSETQIVYDDNGLVVGNHEGYLFQAKVYDNPSCLGINEGRVSKVDVFRPGNIVAFYDREWVIRPDKEHEGLVNSIINGLGWGR